MVYAGILAAGKSTRLHRQDLPKQFLQLGNKPIIIHTLEQFIMNRNVDHIIVVAPDEWLQYSKDLLAKHWITDKRYSVIPGGTNKTQSIGAIFQFIENEFGICEGDLLVAHDAIRPFVTQRVIENHIEIAQKVGAGNTTMKMNDSILVVADDRVDSVPSHENMYAEQTPQSYSLSKMKQLLCDARRKGLSLADESEFPRLWLELGYEMGIVRGEYFNMKILNAYDLEVANALLKERG